MGRKGVKEEVAPAEEAITGAVIRGLYRARESRVAPPLLRVKLTRRDVGTAVVLMRAIAPFTGDVTGAHYQNKPNHHLSLLHNMFSFASSAHDSSLILVLFSLAVYPPSIPSNRWDFNFQFGILVLFSVPWDQILTVVRMLTQMHLDRTSASRGVASLMYRPHVKLVISYGHTRMKGYPEKWSRPVCI
ncbi:hypothetical protein PIB30_007884 [Stylosanthes scabra]|uniref:Uncharacterized protein n=1 Tax=Stylosanthes scabra TaxID=79078 RepID=A0ABU6R544_9FABA|nr:hypothetical protein [Stylosanthes scabra]